MPRFFSALCLAIVMAIPCISLATSDREVLSEIHTKTLSRFVGEEDNSDNEKFHYYHSFTTVTGDCDDFASAAYYELWKRGFNPTIYAYDDLQNEYRHVIVCTEEYCLDNNYNDVLPKWWLTEHVDKELFQIVAQGNLDIVQMYDLGIHEIIARIAVDAA